MNAAARAQNTVTNSPTGVQEKAIVFSKAAQVLEIMREVDRLKLPVLVKYSRTGKAVRALFSSFASEEGLVTLTGISPQGSALLSRSTAVKVEFILLSKKIVFVAEVISRQPGQLSLRVPEKVVAIERRINVRFKVPAKHPAFIRFPERRFDHDDLEAPFLPDELRQRESSMPFLRIDDVSLGGVAGFTRFGAVQRSLKGREDRQKAILYFPDCYPMEVPVSVRWSKKTSMTDNAMKYETLKRIVSEMSGSGCEDSLIIKETFYRVGVQFEEVAKELDTTLRAFMKAVQQAESV